MDKTLAKRLAHLEEARKQLLTWAQVEYITTCLLYATEKHVDQETYTKIKREILTILDKEKERKIGGSI